MYSLTFRVRNMLP